MEGWAYRPTSGCSLSVCSLIIMALLLTFGPVGGNREQARPQHSCIKGNYEGSPGGNEQC